MVSDDRRGFAMWNEMSRNSKGIYQRDLGWKKNEEGSYVQHRFYLGKDRLQAPLRLCRLEKVWDAVVLVWQRDHGTERPLWDEVTLQIAQAISRGEEGVSIDLPQWATADDTDEASIVSWLRRLRQDFPMIDIHLTDNTVEAAGSDYWQRYAQELREQADRIERRHSKYSWQEALDHYGEHLKQAKVTTAGKPTQFVVVTLREIKYVEEHTSDVNLAQFDAETIHHVFEVLRKRPTGKKGQCSARYAYNCIKMLRRFLKWLHREKKFGWKLPADYEVTPVKIPMTPAEISKKRSPAQVQTFTVDELKRIWDHATPIRRLYMLLALNCGFGAMEVGTLQQNEVFLEQPHGYYDAEGSYIKRVRTKTLVYGEWELWDETVQAIKWYRSQRPRCAETALLVSKEGRSLVGGTSGDNRSVRIQNEWYDVLKKARGKKALRNLSFGKLRKTAGDLVRRFSDGETAAIFLCHGQPVSDSLLDCYTNRDFQKVFAACRKVREYLGGVLLTGF